MNPKASSGKTAGPEYSLSEIAQMERFALEKANRTISAIENAFAVWDAASAKPEDQELRMERLRVFYDAIVAWEKKTLKTLGKDDQAQERVERLREFVRICQRYG